MQKKYQEYWELGLHQGSGSFTAKLRQKSMKGLYT